MKESMFIFKIYLMGSKFILTLMKYSDTPTIYVQSTRIVILRRHYISNPASLLYNMTVRNDNTHIHSI